MAMKTRRRAVMLVAVLAPGLVAAAQAEEIQTMQPVPIERTAPTSRAPISSIELKRLQPMPSERLSPMSRPPMPLTEMKAIQSVRSARGIGNSETGGATGSTHTRGVPGQTPR